jgi:hypothetical protein
MAECGCLFLVKGTALGGVSGDFINTRAAVHSLRSTDQEKGVATPFYRPLSSFVYTC